MSTLLADTIRKTGGSSGVDIRIKNNSVYESEGGTSVTQNMVQSLNKGWASVQKYSSNISVFDSLNVSSGVDDGVGHTTLNWSNNMSAAGHYAAGGMSSDQNYMCANQGRTAAAGTALTTSSGAFSTVSDAGADKDSNVNLMVIMGDLA
jgi:hypothetical protein